MIDPRLKYSSRKSYLRKIHEILTAFRLELYTSKPDILEGYFNNVYYGNLAYGVQSASRTYFSKDASDLSLSESALLAGIVASPSRYDPFINLDSAQKRKNTVLKRMYEESYINKEQLNEAVDETVYFTSQKYEIEAPHFTDYIYSQLEDLDLKTDEGIKVYTTLDSSLNKFTQETAFRIISNLKEEHDVTNSAVIAVDNETGQILAMVGGVDYFDLENGGKINMVEALRQPGSAIKPVTYITALSTGYTPATLIYDVPTEYKTKSGDGFIPNNYDGKYRGPVLIREALASSLNLPAVEMLNRIGIDAFLQTSRNLGITTFKRESQYDLSVTLGGGETTLFQLTRAYSTIANMGYYRDFYAIEYIETDSGKILYKHEKGTPQQVLLENGKEAAYLISDILSDPTARIPGFGERTPLNLFSHRAAVKTGTTTDWHDNWTLGYTPDFTVGVWVGNSDNSAMREITGVLGAGSIWHDVFEEILKGKPDKWYKEPDNIVILQICKESGLLSDGTCPEVINEKFIKGTEPAKVSNWHELATIDKRNGLLAGEKCEEKYVVKKVFSNYPSELYSWALRNKIELKPASYSPFCGGAGTDVIHTSNPDVTIISPKEGAVFEDSAGLINNEAVAFEVQVSNQITSVDWYLNGSRVNSTMIFPFSYFWEPKEGDYIIKAYGKTNSGGTAGSEEKHFKVVPAMFGRYGIDY